MKKLILAVLLIVCVLSLSLSAVSASIPVCPGCGEGGIEIRTQTTETLVGTVPCSHHPGYTDSTYDVEVLYYYYCINCGYYTAPIRTVRYTQIVCGYDGSIIIQ